MCHVNLLCDIMREIMSYEKYNILSIYNFVNDTLRVHGKHISCCPDIVYLLPW